MTLQPFKKWVIDFVGLIHPQGKTRARCIITATKYLTHWTKAQPGKDCMGVIAAKFLFEHVLMRFGCPKILMSDCGMHFLNEMINILVVASIVILILFSVLSQKWKKIKYYILTGNKREWRNFKEMIYFMLLVACEREKPEKRSKPSAWQVTDLMVIMWITRTKLNSKSDARNYKTELKPQLIGVIHLKDTYMTIIMWLTRTRFNSENRRDGL